MGFIDFEDLLDPEAFPDADDGGVLVDAPADDIPFVVVTVYYLDETTVEFKDIERVEIDAQILILRCHDALGAVSQTLIPLCMVWLN